jgi:hypothetical protein
LIRLVCPLLLCVLTLTQPAAAQVDVPYLETFEGSLPSNNAWADVQMTSLNALGRFQGNRGGGERTELRVRTTPGTDYVLTFDLYIFDDWRGTGGGNSSDLFQVKRDGQNIFSHSFATVGRAMSYPQPPDQIGALGYGSVEDAVFKTITVPFSASSGQETRISWQGQNIRSPNQQSWGIDNVRIITAEAAALEASQNNPQGLVAEWYFPLTTGKNLASVPWDKPQMQTTVSEINWVDLRAIFAPGVPGEKFAVRVTGTITVEQAGQWSFRLGSDDGSDMHINGSRVINNDGLHSFKWVTGSVDLTAGTHEFQARMYEWTGRQGFALQWRQPGSTNWVVVPASAFAPPVSTFADMTKKANFAHVTTTSESHPSGWYWGDLTGNGFLDAIATGNSTSSIFYNRGDGLFKVGTLGSGAHFGQGALADFNNDGHLDFFASSNGSDSEVTLFLNDGTGTLVRSPFDAIKSLSGTRGTVATDVNADGLCDLILFASSGNFVTLNNGGEKLTFSIEDGTERGLTTNTTTGDGGFVSAADLNADGTTDLFYQLGRGVLLTATGKGSYETTSNGLNGVFGSSIRTSIAFADYNNDGMIDALVGRSASGNPARLLRNDGSQFTDVTTKAGINYTLGTRAAAWGDYNNDGLLDLFLAGATSAAPQLLRANPDGSFTHVETQTFGTEPVHDAVFVDYDNDGNLDLALSSKEGTARLFRNTLGSNHSLTVRLLGAGERATNAAAIGTRIELLNANGELLGVREIGQATGYAGQQPLWAHFGGVNPEETYTIRAHFVTGPVEATFTPTKTSTTIGGTTIERMVTIEEPAPPARARIIRWQEVSASDDE